MFTTAKRILISRSSTLRYDMVKTLVSRCPQYDMKREPWFKAFRALKVCSYCSSPITGRSQGDHINSLVVDGNLRSITNFSSLCVPCCSGCNSSKGNRGWREFVVNRPAANTEFLERVEELINREAIRYNVNQEQFNRANERMLGFLNKLYEEVGDIDLGVEGCMMVDGYED